jgi:hypothetical protein
MQEHKLMHTQNLYQSQASLPVSPALTVQSPLQFFCIANAFGGQSGGLISTWREALKLQKIFHVQVVFCFGAD